MLYFIISTVIGIFLLALAFVEDDYLLVFIGIVCLTVSILSGFSLLKLESLKNPLVGTYQEYADGVRQWIIVQEDNTYIRSFDGEQSAGKYVHDEPNNILILVNKNGENHEFTIIKSNEKIVLRYNDSYFFEKEPEN